MRSVAWRFWAKVVRAEGEHGCWIWTGSRHPKGYGYFGYHGKTTQAHRVAYELAKGPIPEGLQIDHLCRNRACVNPDHLEAVTCRTNILRGQGVAARHAAKTHCPNGHPYDLFNTRITNGQRFCRICRRTQPSVLRRKNGKNYGPRLGESNEEMHDGPTRPPAGPATGGDRGWHGRPEPAAGRSDRPGRAQPDGSSASDRGGARSPAAPGASALPAGAKGELPRERTCASGEKQRATRSDGAGGSSPLAPSPLRVYGEYTT